MGRDFVIYGRDVDQIQYLSETRKVMSAICIVFRVKEGPSILMGPSFATAVGRDPRGSGRMGPYLAI